MGADHPIEQIDVIVVGGGMAGLAAAYLLRNHNVVLLEQNQRLGGRVFSQPAGDYWLNFGAHMFGGPQTPEGMLVSAMGLPSRPINGRLMGISYHGRCLLQESPETYPFRLPLSLQDRLQFIRMGLALRLGSYRVNSLKRGGDTMDAVALRDRILSFENDRTLTQFIGPLTSEVKTLLRAITERNGADPDDMAAGHGLSSFANVWGRHAPGNNIVGGSSLLPEALHRKLLGRTRLGHEVVDITQTGEGVAVRYRAEGAISTIFGKAVVVAVPAVHARRIVSGLPERTARALQQIRYGAFLTAGVLTRERVAMPWDQNYAVATPARSFSVLFNMVTTLRQGPRQPGGSLMLFRGAKGAEAMMEKSDAAIEKAFADDLIAEFPAARGNIDTMRIQRWEIGAPFSAPGRANLQADLTASLGRVALAGDYLEFPNMGAAVTTGQEAALKILKFIESK